MLGRRTTGTIPLTVCTYYNFVYQFVLLKQAIAAGSVRDANGGWNLMNDRNVTPVDYPTVEKLPAYMLFYGRPSKSPIVAAAMAGAVGTLGVRVDTGPERQLVASTSSQLPQDMGAGPDWTLAKDGCWHRMVGRMCRLW